MLEQGHVIADCTVIRQLAQFNSRQEYLVQSEVGEKKLVQFSGSPNWSRSQRQIFHDQIKALGALNVSAVGVPIRVIEQDGKVFCLYPLPPGVPLHNSLSDERSIRATLELFQAITDLLEPAHQQQLFHGALSPHTVYLADGHPFLSDFSLASLVAFDDRTVAEAEYASPEQIRGEPPTTAADTYSLGCLFYSLLMGKGAFSGGDAFAIGMQHLNDSFPTLPESLAFCAELLEGMTAKVASERLPLAQVRAQCEGLLSLEDLDQVPHRPDLTSAGAEERRIQQDALVMVARIENQLRGIESASTDPAATPEKQADEELSLSPAASQQLSTNRSSTRRLLPLLVGLVVGFCLGALFFDLILTRSGGAPTTTVFSVDDVAPDYTDSTHLWLEGDLDGAERELNRLLVNFPDHPQIHNNLAAVAAVRGDVEAARELLEQAIVLDVQTATIYSNLGSIYAEIARDSYGRALQFDYEQTPLQLAMFTNQGVVSSPLGADTIVAQGSPAADEGKVAAEGVEDAVPLLSEGGSATKTSDVTNIPLADADVSAESAVPSVSSSKGAEEEVDPVVQKQDPVAEQSPPVPVTTDAAAESREDPVHFLERWAAAWSAQDVEGYLVFYSDDFIPTGGLDYDEWVMQRRERLQRPEEITVTLSAAESRREVDGLLQIEVIQDYNSERYSDRTRKLFDLRRHDDSWKIERERSLELIYR